MLRVVRKYTLVAWASLLTGAVTSFGCGTVAKNSDGGAGGSSSNDGGAGGTGAGGAGTGVGGSGTGVGGAVVTGIGGAPSVGTGGRSGTGGAVGTGGRTGTGGSNTACSLATPFGAPAALADLETTASEDGFSLAANGLSAYFSTSRPGGAGGFDIFSATRSLTDRFTDITVLGGALNTAADERGPRISADGLRIYYSVNTTAATGTYHIQVATRNTVGAVFGAGQPLAGINSTASESDVFLVADESVVYFASSRSGGLGSYDLYTATRTASGAFGTPRALSEVSSVEEDGAPVVSADQLTIYFASRRAGTGAHGDHDIWMAHRSTIADGFGTPENLGPLNGAGLDFPLLISDDQCTLYFGTNSMGAGGYDLYVARRAR